MSTPYTRTRRRWPHVAGFFAVAALVHLLAVWAAPSLIVYVVGRKVTAIAANPSRSGTEVDTQNGTYHAPQVTAQSRSVVMPSPDMLYSVCTFDVAKEPLHISANPGLNTYWSIALYAANSDNFYVLNDRKAQGQAVDITLVSRSSPQAGKAGTVVAPTDTGILLMRVLTGNYAAEKAMLEPARRTLKCTAAKTPT